jgi:hypothetical protein
LMAPYCWATRVISRMSDSVKIEVRFEVRGTAQGILSCMPGLSAVSFGITSRLAA